MNGHSQKLTGTRKRLIMRQGLDLLEVTVCLVTGMIIAYFLPGVEWFADLAGALQQVSPFEEPGLLLQLGVGFWIGLSLTVVVFVWSPLDRLKDRVDPVHAASHKASQGS